MASTLAGTVASNRRLLDSPPSIDTGRTDTTSQEWTSTSEGYSPSSDSGRLCLDFRHSLRAGLEHVVLLQDSAGLLGDDVELGGGLMQFDPNIGFRDLAGLVTPSQGTTRVKDGAMVYCKDCRKANTGLCSQGQMGTDGAFAKRINGQWRCD